MANGASIVEAGALLACGKVRESLFLTSETLEAYIRYLAVQSGAIRELVEGNPDKLAAVPLPALIDFLIEQHILRYRHKAEIREVRRLVDEARRHDVGPSIEQANGALRFLKEFVTRNETTAASLMRSPVIGIDRDQPVSRAVAMMRERGLHQLPVLEKGVPTRCLTTGTLQRWLDDGTSALGRMPVWEVAERALPQIPRSMRLPHVLRELRTHPALLVVEGEKIVGIVTIADVLQVIREYD
ncbi:MAG: CBS domain-containing protein [Actinobacteria bacterium]|nr:MAG: CBS domain-containing protein [Actinomycetota bacterium]